MRTDPKKCLKCGNLFVPEIADGADGEQYEVNTKLCYTCFEDGVEDFEEKRRERIARESEH